MEMDFLHRVGPAEPTESRPSYKEDQVWKDIENETGFASCADYMRFYAYVRPDFVDRLGQYRAIRKGQHSMRDDGTKFRTKRSNYELSIYDLSKQVDSAKCLRFRHDCDSGTELIRALRNPPRNVCVQIVFWSSSLASPLTPFSQEMADAVILGLKLDPQLLEDLEKFWEGRDDYHTIGFRNSHIQRLLGYGVIAILSQNFMDGSAKAVPVLLVAANEKFYGERDSASATSFNGGGRRKPPFSSSVTYTMGFSGASLYAKTVEEFIAQSRITFPTEAVLLLAAGSPLLYNEASRVQKALLKVQDTYDELMSRKLDHSSLPGMAHKDILGDLDIQRLVLRRTIEKGENYARQFFRYLCLDIDVDWSKEPSYVSIEADWKSLIEEARRLETEVRDYMQIQVGNLSLEESRRSIELSNVQIRESQNSKSC